MRAALHAVVSIVALTAGTAAHAQAAEPVVENAASGDAEPQQELRFDIMEFVVRGNTMLTPAEIQIALTPFTGYAKTVENVNSAKAAFEAVYRAKGYNSVIVDVPQQDVSSGIIELAVTEGRVGNVRVTGADFVLPSEVRGSVPSLTKGQVPNVFDLQRELANSNARSTRSIVPEFRAGTAPGTVDVDLVVTDKRPWGASIELNDQYNRSTERLRVAATAHYDNLWQAGHSLSVSFQVAPEDFNQVQAISGSYYAPIGYGRTSLLAYVVNSNTDVATVGGLTVLGNGLTVGGRLMRTLGDSPAGTVQTLMFGADYKDYLDQIGLMNAGERLTIDTPVTYLPFTTQYRWIRVREKVNAEFSIGATAAFDGLVGKQAQFGGIPYNWTRPNDPPVTGKRDNAQASFLFFSGAGRYERKFEHGIDARLAIDWQLATDPLISNEQFVLGGLGSVRGYREAEVLGDSGVRGSLEVGYKLPFTGEKIDWRVAAFVEGGHAWLERPLPEEVSHVSIGSAGLTTSFDLFSIVSGQLDLAYQFSTDPTKSGTPVDTDLEGARVHFKIGVKY